jgi:hypothetical protein
MDRLESGGSWLGNPDVERRTLSLKSELIMCQDLLAVNGKFTERLDDRRMLLPLRPKILSKRC